METIKVMPKGMGFTAAIPGDSTVNHAFGGDAAHAITRLILANAEKFELKIDLPPNHGGRV